MISNDIGNSSKKSFGILRIKERKAIFFFFWDYKTSDYISHTIVKLYEAGFSQYITSKLIIGKVSELYLN